MKRLIVLVTVAGVALGAIQGAHAMTKAHTVTQTKIAGPYKLTIVIGPAAMMSMHGMTGERMLGGKAATCHMSGSTSSMNMHAGACNHHVELHVYNKANGHVVTGVHVVIQLIDMTKHMTIHVPIMTMEDARMGASDFHYGNNVYAGSGMYTVKATVNSVHAQFTVNLM